MDYSANEDIFLYVNKSLIYLVTNLKNNVDELVDKYLFILTF